MTPRCRVEKPSRKTVFIRKLRNTAAFLLLTIVIGEINRALDRANTERQSES